ncbi:glycosyl-4,4'-diaponeurosporenoate acyltransferase [Virgibacillus halodenitrificans]|uniref:glycosyl-4,4'-diaponeurosporenoate acyltransferase CrtO family protein n=1 Tax=Virgibacillus halodenitrificans TaxID=1482 RepID=UPI000EF52779|nr:glycosyl-4,4'-diaponeurosporenoate acyltransferase [Virgibacillus halodenitrificans]
MPVIELPLIIIILLDIVAWAFFHIVISLGMSFVSADWLQKYSCFFRSREWERDGMFWEHVFKVRSFKKWIPDGSKIIGRGFEKRNLKSVDQIYIEQFIIESIRAEITHLLSILPAGLFFLWNPSWAGWIMIGYALLFNIPIIAVQRYNRPRLERIIRKYK